MFKRRIGTGKNMLLKQVYFKRKALISLLMGMFVLSGCGQSDNLLTETVDNCVNETIDMNFTETEGIEISEEKAEEDGNNVLSEDLPKPSEVPVNTQAEEIRYCSSDDIDLLRAMHRCISDGENIYLVYGEPDLFVMPIGADEHIRMNIDNPQGMDVCHIAMDTYGRIHLLMADSDSDKWFIWRLDEDCQIDKVIDISAYFETKQMPLWFQIDKDGTYYFQWAMNRNGIIVGSEGELKHRFTPESLGIKWIYEAAAGKDGRICLVYGDGDDRLEIGEFDMENCSIIKEDSFLWFPQDETFSEMSGGTDTNFLLFSPYSGIWAFDHEKGVLENRVSISDIGFDSNMEFWPLTFLLDGRLLLLGKSGDGDYLKYIPAGK